MDYKKDTFSQKMFDIFTNGRVLLLIFFVILALFAMNIQFGEKGVVINGVVPGSIAEQAGFEFDSGDDLSDFEEVLRVGGFEITTPADFYSQIDSLEKNTSFIIETNLGTYSVFNPISNGTVSERLGISVNEEARSNIRLGIELEGGSRLILKTNDTLSDSDFELLVNTLQSRLDVYGASGTKVNSLEDAFSDDQFIIIESISSNKNDIFELVQRQGNFEAILGEELVFTGANVVRVFNDPQHASLQGCSESGTGIVCTFSFSIQIDTEGTDQFFDVSKDLQVIGGRLSEEIRFVLDEKNITSLSVSSSFKYQKISQPQISVSGSPAATESAAIASAQREMKFLQTILSTQSLPTELEVVQSYSISSSLGEELLSNSILVGITALLLVSSVVALRYREFGLFIAIFAALITEVIIVFGVAAFMRLAIDLAAIGGLIAAIGTGVDDQIIITDEYFRKRKISTSSKKRIKGAIKIIMIAYLTTLAAMIPLNFAGLKILQGFAFMIIVGVTVGVFITRPAYAAALRIMMTTRDQRKKEREEELEEE
jgi:preprotein translocase subunit SecD